MTRSISSSENPESFRLLIGLPIDNIGILIFAPFLTICTKGIEIIITPLTPRFPILILITPRIFW
ncbi:hypothetical protein THIOM_000716 [Candidatus Thiomargarita nelsonii]|uniref:Uncharacterized protein n=1 Tax=Candidatus Thiomargarita nelsonii TaxID=1003181 RepID=A0A176S5P0_9GAMM|nr:hypothetical protein THIOM_000716 [Candidatus Thiomargarita nelsonii]